MVFSFFLLLTNPRQNLGIKAECRDSDRLKRRNSGGKRFLNLRPASIFTAGHDTAGAQVYKSLGSTRARADAARACAISRRCPWGQESIRQRDIVSNPRRQHRPHTNVVQPNQIAHLAFLLRFKFQTWRGEVIWKLLPSRS